MNRIEIIKLAQVISAQYPRRDPQMFKAFVELAQRAGYTRDRATGCIIGPNSAQVICRSYAALVELTLFGGEVLDDLVTVGEAGSERPIVPPTAQTHVFWSASLAPDAGGHAICGRQVERPDGRFEKCGEPAFSPAHNPGAYLAYHAELHAELFKWRMGDHLSAPRLDLVHPFVD